VEKITGKNTGKGTKNKKYKEKVREKIRETNSRGGGAEGDRTIAHDRK
jgi:hypothetical protein